MHVLVDLILGLGLAAAYAAQMLRWLRVLQREHYEATSMGRFYLRWLTPDGGEERLGRRILSWWGVLPLAFVLLALGGRPYLAALITVLAGLTCPVGLSWRGRTSALQWTRRLRVTAALALALSVLVSVLVAVAGASWAGAMLMVWLVPLVLDVSTRLLAPYERRSAMSFVAQARKRLDRVAPRVVGITGSFGKTSTKNHLFDLLSGEGGVVASPRSFNNRAGLSRSINENLADGTRIFIAEMGTFGPGEIRDLCEWCPPELAVVTAIGPVHLERMKSLDVIEQAKFEITTRANTVVVNLDDPRLATWVARLESSGKRVRTAASNNPTASVRVVVERDQWRLFVDGRDLGATPARTGVQPTNVACAMAAALELGVDESTLVSRVASINVVANRSNVAVAASGVTVIDDTFNANPASAGAALALLTSLPLSGRRVVVTPGMVELGPVQFEENASFARAAAAAGVELVAVGRTNAKALQQGFGARVHHVRTRDDAVAWVRQNLGPTDGVLYLNDLPDHYP